jgi:hypothetical protein
LLARGAPPVGGADELANVPMLGGVYLAGTGRETADQAFVQGVFQRVLDGQNAVSWSPEAVADDARLNRLTVMGYVGLAVFVALSVAGVVFLR